MQRILLSIIFLNTVLFASAQVGKVLPDVTVEGLDGQRVSTAEFDNEGQPIIISFWATWCKPCINELNAIHDVYIDWQDETGVKLIAISIDDTRQMAMVAPLVNGKGWDYEVYIDKNSDLKRALNVVNIPHTLLLDSEKKIVYQHTSYAPGDEEALYDEVLNLVESGE